MAQFKAFKPEAMEKIARSMGHQGDMNTFQQFLVANPDKKNMMDTYELQAKYMALGGYVRKMQEGGDTNEGDTTEGDNTQSGGLMDDTIENINNPQAPKNTELDPKKIGDSDDDSQTIKKGTGDIDKDVDIETGQGEAKQAGDAKDMDAETYDATQVKDKTPKAETKTTTVSDEMLVKAAQGKLTDEERATYEAALKAGQAEVTRKATVQGQLEEMNKNIEDGSIPSYATAAVRAAMNAMAARGLGASSMATGAMVNAILESSIPIAKADADTYKEYGLQNATNAQMATLAKAAALSSLNITNLNNRQQAVVENAKTFLKVDLANLTNAQQTELTNVHNMVQTLLSDQAADNAAKQFNATSENQVNQFMASLVSNIEQFNASQLNAMETFNVGEENAMEKFVEEQESLREQFETKNQLLIEQFNATWKQQIVTTDTAAENYANEFNAKALLDISNTAYANMWSHMSDMMEWAWTSGESGKDRVHEITLANIDAKLRSELKHLDLDAGAWGDIGEFVSKMMFSPASNTMFSKIFSFF